MRFEAVTAAPAGSKSGKPVNLPGTVSDVLFMGANLEVKIKCGDQQIIAILPSGKGTSLQPMQEVVVSFDPADGHVFNV